jgi:phage terminase large subunit GpA-like protein
MVTIADVRRGALAALRPPPRLRLSEWIERTIVLPDDVSALPGRVRLWTWQRAIADCFTDPAVERITLQKPARCGFATLLTAAVGYFATDDPSPILCVLPTECPNSRHRRSRRLRGRRRGQPGPARRKAHAELPKPQNLHRLDAIARRDLARRARL